ncbi:membrane-spanning 4-domains subfamily A member 15-like [Parambassis ranga]|uniref:Membrane-spanning 4-domains subfamily A member 15-like n=1 Tax=Parambassis ranga TaxID=210632 RepID=A0A6P7JWF6_9TELE|nr:membrane-spanning 4-domains subfamily A member 15-like [Parambassis ranga]
MSLTISKSDGFTVLTLSADPQSPCPPLCQILKTLCYSPTCYQVSPYLRGAQRRSQLVLGTLQIMIGLMNIGLGVLLCVVPSASSWLMDSTGFPFWLAALFILFGVMCIVSEKHPSPCLVTLNAILNVIGVAFAITAIVLYSMNMVDISVWMCESDNYWYGRTTPSPSRDQALLQEKCLRGKEMLLMVLRGINGILIVLSVLELCVVFSAAVLGIQTLRSKEKATKPEVIDDPELYSPLLEEGGAPPTA